MGGVTASGYPYVTPTDHPKEFPAHSQALANKLEADGGWTTYVPTVTGAGVSAVVAEYAKAGKVITVQVKLTVTSMSGPLTITLPVSADSSALASAVGEARMVVAGNIFLGVVYVSTNAALGVYAMSGTAGGMVPLTSAIPATWASGNSLHFTATYKSAT